MGLFSKIKGEFIDIIEWLDPSNDIMVHRFERYHNEIKNGAKLTVRESQVAVFVNEGQVADVFQPGMHELTTNNLPILSTLKGWKYGFNSPFKAEVYFINTKNFTDNKWGTKNPVMMRDADFGVIRMRAFGNYALKVGDPVKFIREIAGTDGKFTTDEITEQLRNVIITRFTDSIAESKIPALDLAANYDEMSKLVMDKVQPEFEEYGLKLTKFLVENISLPPEVEKAIDKRSSMGVIGNLGAYAQFQAAESMEAAAKNPGGGASDGIGMGMGFAMANQMGNMFNQNQNQNQNQQQHNNMAPPPPPTPPQMQIHAVINGQQTGPHAEANLRTMIQQNQITKETLVWKAGMAGWVPADQLPEVAAMFAQVPPPPPPVPNA
ncbi:MAG: SPFH domain-containing protein [Bacteroidetes bacterium]|nr:SPFH domain-containing protein [Bacteroidota bacterium]